MVKKLTTYSPSKFKSLSTQKSPPKTIEHKSQSRTEEAAKLKQAREHYRNFKNEMQVVHLLKEHINPSNPRESFEVAYKIESLLKSQKDHRFLLTKSQNKVMEELYSYMTQQKIGPKQSKGNSSSTKL